MTMRKSTLRYIDSHIVTLSRNMFPKLRRPGSSRSTASRVEAMWVSDGREVLVPF